MPDATVIPVLAYPDPIEAAGWLVRAFGFRERLRIGDHRVQLSFGDGALVLTGGNVGSDDSIMLRVADLADRHALAVAAGAAIASEPTDYEFGERQFTAVDPYRRRWTFSQTIRDADPLDWGGRPMDDDAPVAAVGHPQGVDSGL